MTTNRALVTLVLAGGIALGEAAPALADTPAECAQVVAPAWCADLPPEDVQMQLPGETTGRDIQDPPATEVEPAAPVVEKAAPAADPAPAPEAVPAGPAVDTSDAVEPVQREVTDWQTVILKQVRAILARLAQVLGR